MASCPGSSPLTRGKPTSARPASLSPRLIPAHAGKTDGGIQTAVARKAHPRSRGENAGAGAGIAAMSGSSPLTRGKRTLAGQYGGVVGLIPAHAGKTNLGCNRCARHGAHPRSRGENMPRKIDHKRISGSSPLTRGKPSRSQRNAGQIRLIPAHAGKTSPGQGRPRWCAAHPRSRGENEQGRTPFLSPLGSSPLTRGKLDDVQRGPVGPRLIPAHAGKTLPVSPRRSRTRAHPRSRGENMGLPIGYVSTPGSSPLTRGKHGPTHRLRFHPGLIPAHAGKTGQRLAWCLVWWAHPRSRGENRPTRRSRVHQGGSSPLTRGKR